MNETLADREIEKAAATIARRCRRVIQSILREEEVADCDQEFQEIAAEVMKELAAFKEKA